MRAFLTPFALALALLALPTPALAGGEGWIHNIEKAKEQAKKEGKSILVDFTGSDWCGWCIKLNKEVFSKPEFKTWAAKNLILVELDFPRRTPQDAATKAYNRKWQKAFGVRGFPSIYLLDSEGRPYFKTGYKRGGPAVYIKHLEDAAPRKAKVKALIDATAKGTPEERLAALEKARVGLSAMKLPSAAFSGLRKQWLKLAVQLVDADTTNAKGHVTKYGGKLALHFLSTKDTAKFDKYLAMVKKHDPKAATNIEIEAELMKLQQGARRDPAGTLTKLKALLGRGATGEALQKIHWMLAGMTFRSDKAAAKVHLEKALAAAPNSEIGKQIPNILKRAFKGH